MCKNDQRQTVLHIHIHVLGGRFMTGPRLVSSPIGRGAYYVH